MLILSQLQSFLLHFVTALALLSLFIAVYLRLTPYAELKLIRQGNQAAALALSGAIIGFALPMASSITHSVTLQDMAIWASIAMLVQAATYTLATQLMPELKQGIAEGQIAHGTFLAGLSITIGLINAACMSY